MLESLKKLLHSTGAMRPDWSDIAAWAESQGYRFKRARDDAGFVIDGALEDGKAWRLEWGPPQRDFIGERELRLRIDVALPSDMQMLVMSRPLMDRLEARMFDEQVQGTQTRIDAGTPEEVRWLVMFRPVDLTPMRAVRLRFGAVASQPESGFSWIEGPLAQALERSAQGLTAREPAFLLMTLRGKVYLRCGLVEPDAALLGQAVQLFECAVLQALRASHGRTQAGEWPASGSTAWQSIHGDDLGPQDGPPPASATPAVRRR